MRECWWCRSMLNDSIHAYAYPSRHPPILVHAAAIHFFLPHRFIFGLGYGQSEDEAGAANVIMLSMLLELGLELITDHAAIYAEEAHGVPIVRYFELLTNSWVAIEMVGSMG